MLQRKYERVCSRHVRALSMLTVPVSRQFEFRRVLFSIRPAHSAIIAYSTIGLFLRRSAAIETSSGAQSLRCTTTERFHENMSSRDKLCFNLFGSPICFAVSRHARQAQVNLRRVMYVYFPSLQGSGRADAENQLFRHGSLHGEDAPARAKVRPPAQRINARHVSPCPPISNLLSVGETVVRNLRGVACWKRPLQRFHVDVVVRLLVCASRRHSRFALTHYSLVNKRDTG